MEYKFNNERPIYKQIMEAIGIEILKGTYLPGEKILSVREFATLYQVNPNTIQRALNELEEQGLIVTMRTNGKFVTEEHSHIDHLKKRLAQERMDQYFIEMQKIGFSNEEAIHILEKRG